MAERCVQFSRASSHRCGVYRGLVFMFSLPLLARSKSVYLKKGIVWGNVGTHALKLGPKYIRLIPPKFGA